MIAAEKYGYPAISTVEVTAVLENLVRQQNIPPPAQHLPADQAKSYLFIYTG